MPSRCATPCSPASGELDLNEGGPSTEATASRRSIYTTKKRNSQNELLRSLDAPAGFRQHLRAAEHDHADAGAAARQWRLDAGPRAEARDAREVRRGRVAIRARPSRPPRRKSKRRRAFIEKRACRAAEPRPAPDRRRTWRSRASSRRTRRRSGSSRATGEKEGDEFTVEAMCRSISIDRRRFGAHDRVALEQREGQRRGLWLEPRRDRREVALQAAQSHHPARRRRRESQHRLRAVASDLRLELGVTYHVAVKVSCAAHTVTFRVQQIGKPERAGAARPSRRTASAAGSARARRGLVIGGVNKRAPTHQWDGRIEAARSCAACCRTKAVARSGAMERAGAGHLECAEHGARREPSSPGRSAEPSRTQGRSRANRRSPTSATCCSTPTNSSTSTDPPPCPAINYDHPTSRRDFLRRAGCGFGAVALAALMGERVLGARRRAGESALAPNCRSAPGRAKSVIFLFMEGGPSHIDTFDPKPLLNELAGQQLPAELQGTSITRDGREQRAAARVQAQVEAARPERPVGLRLARTLAQHADDLAVIRSCGADGLNHSGGVCQMNTGSILGGRPSLGAWVSYGLGTENAEPAGVRRDAGQRRHGRQRPAQLGRRLHAGRLSGHAHSAAAASRSRTSTRPTGVSDARQRGKLDFLAGSTASTPPSAPDQTELDARIAQLRARLPHAGRGARGGRSRAGDRGDARRSTAWTDKETATFGRNCLLARRLVERGVRFVQLYQRRRQQVGRARQASRRTTASSAASMDKPIAGLLQGPEAPRPARRDARRLGRRVRPHADEREGRRPRPQPLRLHHVDGRRRREGRPDHRRDRRARPARRRGPPARPRPARHDPAPAGPRPHAASSTATKAAPSAHPQRRRRLREDRIG